MNRIVVEHVFVTGLPNAQAMQLLGEILTARRFKQQGEPHLDPARPDWTLVRYRRGNANAAKVRAVAQFPQELHVEWDRGRFSLALSLDPLRAKRPVRQQCEKLLLWIAWLLEQALTGTRSADLVLAEWAPAEDSLVLPPKAAGRHRGRLISIPVGPWIWTCIGLCGLMLLWSLVGATIAAWGKMILVAAGAGAMVLLWKLKNHDPPIPAERARLMSAGLAGASWSLAIATTYLVPLVTAGTHRALAAGRSQSPAPSHMRWTVNVTDTDGTRAALQSADSANQDAAVLGLSSEVMISPDAAMASPSRREAGHRILHVRT